MSRVLELDELSIEVVYEIGPQLISAIQVSPNIIHLYFSDNLNEQSVQNISNYNLNGFSVGIDSAYLIFGRKVVVILDGAGNGESIEVSGLIDASGNYIDPLSNSANIDQLLVTPHLVGSFNDWDPANHDYDFSLNENGIWMLELALEAGDYEYKVIESNEWDDNDWPYENQIIELNEYTEIDIKVNCGFYTGSRNWDEFVTHYNPIIVGDFISELGGEDWTVSDLTGMMLDADNDGIFSLEVLIPEGEWEYKVVLNQSFDQDTYGNGGNFYLSSDGIVPTIFYYDFEQNSTYYIQNNQSSYPGDANLDNDVNVIDVVTMVSYILGQISLGENAFENADMNNDVDVNVVDIVLVVELILNN